MRKAGAIVLTVWSGLNLVAALAVTVVTLVGRPPPALQLIFDDAQIAAADPRLIGVINTQALIANPLIIGFCALVIAVVWASVVRGQRWAISSVAGSTLFVQAFGFVSDASMGHRNLTANVVSSVVLLVGLGLSASVQRGREV